jgi:serine/threonine protein kinase
MRLEPLGRYELLEEIGRGAMGVVFRARDPLIDRIVAIKTINVGLSRVEAEDFGKRFDREARSAGRLNHPNIVTIYDVGKSGDVAYLAMELLEGQSLRDILDSGVVLPPSTIADIAAQIADGLASAHQAGVIHCDIKPANVVVLASGLVKITDFGIARMRTNDVKTMTGMILGSPKYMSPEQVAGKRADYRSDLFSLGVVLHEMLTGQPPFQADTVHGLMYQTLNSTPAAPSSLNPELPEIVDLIVAKALSKNVEERYQSAADLAKDLRDCKEMLQGRTTEPSVFSAAQTGAPPAPTATRRHDKVLTMKSASMKAVNGVPDKPALTLAKAFDSYEATMRLAAMTGMDKELAGFADTAPSQSPGAGNRGPATGATRHNSRGERSARATHGRRNGYTWLWIVSVVALAAAAALFVFR